MPRKGRSKKASAAPEDSAAAGTPPDASPLANDSEPKVTKRGHDFTDTEDVPTGRKKTRQNSSPRRRSPLPKRRGRNDDPVGKRAKAARAKETKAAKEAKVAEKRRKEVEVEATKERLAQMEADESFVQAQERQRRIRRRSDMKASIHDVGDHSEGDDADENSNGEEPETDGADDSEDSEKKRAEKKTKKKKKAQPKLRDEVAEKKDKIKGKRGLGVGGTVTTDDSVASGLNTAWLEVQKSKKKRAAEVAEKMDDEAALSTRPDFPHTPTFDRKAADAQLAKANLKRNPSRKNKLVALISESEDSDDSESESALSIAGIRRPIKSRVPSGGKGKEITKPADQKTKKPPQRKKPRRQGSDASDPALDSPPDRGRAAIMPKGGNSLSLLPAVLSSLKGRYLATLYCALYASEEPFDHFVKTSPTFLKVSRQAFKKVWPHLKVTVEIDDALFNVGYQRMLEKRGKIHDAVKASVEHHFLMQKYSTTEIVNWVKWFCGTHGSPVFYETPVPQDATWDANDPDYQKPRGFLKSKFLISIGSRFLQDSQDTAFDFGPPRGLFVLILTAYEKIIRSYRTGIYTPTGDFRAKSCNAWVRQYNKNFNKTADWWEGILEGYVTLPESEQEMIGEMSILDEGRAFLPMSSSP